MRAPIRIAPKPPHELREPPNIACFSTGALGFLGASEDDRNRWVNGFRHLLDGLDTALQVVMRFRPGSGTASASQHSREPPSTREEMRLHDLDFLEQLREQPGAQSRQVLLTI